MKKPVVLTSGFRIATRLQTQAAKRGVGIEYKDAHLTEARRRLGACCGAGSWAGPMFAPCGSIAAPHWPKSSGCWEVVIASGDKTLRSELFRKGQRRVCGRHTRDTPCALLIFREAQTRREKALAWKGRRKWRSLAYERRVFKLSCCSRICVAALRRLVASAQATQVEAKMVATVNSGCERGERCGFFRLMAGRGPTRVRQARGPA